MINPQGLSGVSIIGNEALGQRYIPTARQLLIAHQQTQFIQGMRHIAFANDNSNRYSIDTIDLARHRWVLPDGAQIDVFSNGGANHIVINVTDVTSDFLLQEGIATFFLETGYVDLRVDGGATNPLFASSVEAGKLYYPDYVEDALNDTIPYLDEAVRTDSDPRRGYEKGMDSLAFKAHDGNLGEKRAAWIAFRGPEFTTGKTRLLIQSQYGAEDNADDEDDTAPTLAQYSLPNTQARTYVLYSGESVTEPDYWLLTITPGNVLAQNLAIPDGYRNEFYDRLVEAEEEDRLKIEAYMLSVAQIGDNTISAAIDPVEGSTFAYGWKANSLGTELVMVTSEGVFDAIDNPYHYIQRLYQLSISITQDINTGEYVLSADLDKLEEVNCTPQNGIDLVWVPNLVKNWQETFNWHPSGPAKDKYLAGLIEVDNAPFYAYYNADDKLVVFRYYMLPEQTDGADVAALQSARSAWELSETVCISGTKEGENNWSIEYTISGFYVDIDGTGVPGGLDQRTGAYYVDYSMNIYEDGDTNVLSPSSEPGFDEFSAAGYCRDLVGSGWQDEFGRYPIQIIGAQFSLTRKRSNNTSITGDSILVIPFADDCACLGTMTGLSGLMDYFDATKDVYSHIISLEGGGVNGSQFAANGDGGGVGQGVGSGVLTANSAIHGVSQYEQELDVSFTLYHRHGNETAVTLSASSFHSTDQAEATQEAYFQIGSWVSWFDPPVNVDRTLTPTIRVQESYGNTDDYALVYVRDPTKSISERFAVTDDEIPDDVEPHDSGIFVGWA